MGNLTNKTKSTPADIAAIDAMCVAAGITPYSQVVCALCDVLDGEQDHDIADLGLSAADVADVCRVRTAVVPLWKQINGIH
jgi:hypothetical protein